MQSPTQKTIVNDDGTYTTSLYSAPIQYEDAGGQWHPIDTEVIAQPEDGYELQNRAGDIDVLFESDSGTDDLLRLDVEDAPYKLDLEGVGSTSAVHARNTVTYPDVFPGVDLEYEVMPAGVKETLVLRDRRVKTSYRFNLTTPPGAQVAAEPQGDDSWAFFVDGDTSPTFVLAPPTVTENTPTGESVIEQHQPVSINVTGSSTGFVIDLAVDAEWLADGTRNFPVRIDPTIYVPTTARDTSFNFGNCGTNPCQDTGTRLKMGTTSGQIWRSALQFDLQDIPANATVTSADLRLFFDEVCLDHTTFCGGVDHQINALRLTKGWTSTSAPSSLAWDSTALDSHTLTYRPQAQWMNWDVTSTVQNWLAGHYTNFGFLLKRYGEADGKSGPVVPGEGYPFDDDLRPNLKVVWNSSGVTLEEPTILRANGAELSWSRYGGTAAFQGYEVHRSRDEHFAPSASTLVTTIDDVEQTSYADRTAAPGKFTYKIVVNGHPSNPQTAELPADGTAVAVVRPDARAGKSTYMVSGNCENYGAEPAMRIGVTEQKKYRGLLKFNLKSIARRNGPDPHITSAVLSLYRDPISQSVGNVSVHRVTSSWKEGGQLSTCGGQGATWATRRGERSWTNPGATGDFWGAIATTNVPATNYPAWDEFDVTSVVREWKDTKRSNNGLLIRRQDETHTAGKYLYYKTDDYTVASALRPKLTVTYKDPKAVVDKPEVEVTGPAADPQPHLNGQVRVSASASDDGRVDRVDFHVAKTDAQGQPSENWSLIGSDNSAPFEVDWDSVRADGTKLYSASIRATAIDEAGNSTTSAPVPVKVDNSSTPAVSISTPSADGTTVSGTSILATTASDQDSAIKHVEFFVDGELINRDDAAPWTIQWNTLDPASPVYDSDPLDPYDITARATTTTGQQTVSAARTVFVNNRGTSMYRAILSSSDVPPVMAVGRGPYEITLTVNKDTTLQWNGVSAYYRWVDADGTVVGQGSDTPVGHLSKGNPAEVSMTVAAPSLPDNIEAGGYSLVFDLKDSSGTTFSSKGNRPLTNHVIVAKELETQLGIERYHHYVGDNLGAGMVHMTNVANGNSLLRWTPLSAPGRGLSTVLDLTYNSLEDHSESPVGNNFSLTISSLTRFGLPLDIHPNPTDTNSANKYVAFVDGDGTRHEFIGKTTATGQTYYEEPDGVHLYLRRYDATEGSARAWAITRPDRTTFFYDERGWPTSVEDNNGNVLRFKLEEVPPAEDPGGPKYRITEVTDAAGATSCTNTNVRCDRTFYVSYYSRQDRVKSHVRGKIKSISDHSGGGGSLFFDYYDDGNLLRITQRGGTTPGGGILADRSFVFTYTTSNGAEAAIPNASDRLVPNPKTPNQSSQLYSVADPLKKETIFTYYGPTSSLDRWKLQSITNRDSEKTSYAYDTTTRTTTVSRPLDRVSKFTYDTGGKVTKITHPMGRTTSIAWVSRHVSKVTEGAAGDTSAHWVSYAYDDNGYVTDIKEPVRDVDSPYTERVMHTQLEYEHVAVDANDRTGLWKTGRTTPHISQLKTKTEPNGMATGAAGDYQWKFSYLPNGDLLSVTDPASFTSSYQYNANGTVKSSKDGRGSETLYGTYDNNGFPTVITDPEGNVTKVAYDSDGLLLWAQDPEHLRYESTNRAWKSYRTYFYHDAFHRQVAVGQPKSTAMLGAQVIWSTTSYDANDNVLRSFGPKIGTIDSFSRGPETSMSYDAMDRVLSVVGPDRSSGQEKTTYEYDDAGRVVLTTRPEGAPTSSTKDHATAFTYDDLDRITRETRYLTKADGSVAEEHNTHYCYDVKTGDLTSVTAPNANRTSIDCVNLPGFTTKYAYDAAHRLVDVTDPMGRVSRRRYDLNSNVVSVTDPGGNTQVLTYDERDLLIRKQEPFETGHPVVTEFVYDANGNLVHQVSPRAYDSGIRAADAATWTEPPKYVTGYRYDKNSRLTTVLLPTNGTTGDARTYIHRAYDKNGRLAMTSLPTTVATPTNVAASDKTEMTHYDPGWIATSKVGSNPTVHFDYSPQGWQTSRVPETSDSTSTDVKKDLDELMTWEYYDDGMLKARTDADGGGVSYTYDLNNNLREATDAAGASAEEKTSIEILAKFDSLDRPSVVRHRDVNASGSGSYFATEYAYDPNGNIVRRIDDREEDANFQVLKSGRVNRYTYDESDMMKAQFDERGAGCADDRRTTTAYTPEGWLDTRTIYGAVDTCTDSDVKYNRKVVSEIDYFANGLKKKLSTKQCLHANLEDCGSLVEVESHLASYYDADLLDQGTKVYVNGNRTKDTFTLKPEDGAGPCFPATCTATFDYDARDRLIEHHDGHKLTTTYKLNPAGSVLKEQPSAPTALHPVKTYTYDGGQIDKLVQSVGTTSTDYFYHYDDHGDVECVTKTNVACHPSKDQIPAQSALWSYNLYDELHRLETSKTFANGQVDDFTEYDYDPLDRLVKEEEKEHDEWGSATGPRITEFAYLGLTDLVTQDTISKGTDTAVKTYSYDASGARWAMTDDPQGPDNSKSYFYNYDLHGSVSQLLIPGPAGGVRASYGYYPYGATDEKLSEGDDLTEASGAEKVNPLNPYRYSGRRFDVGSNTIDMGARRFDADNSSFIQQDILSSSLGDLSLSTDPLTANRYSLAGGNPVSFVEYDGHGPVGEDGNIYSPWAMNYSSERNRKAASGDGGESSQSSDQEAAKADDYDVVSADRVEPHSTSPGDWLFGGVFDALSGRDVGDHVDYIADSAGAAGIDPRTLLATIKRESASSTETPFGGWAKRATDQLLAIQSEWEWSGGDNNTIGIGQIPEDEYNALVQRHPEIEGDQASELAWDDLAHDEELSIRALAYRLSDFQEKILDHSPGIDYMAVQEQMAMAHKQGRAITEGGALVSPTDDYLGQWRDHFADADSLYCGGGEFACTGGP